MQYFSTRDPAKNTFSFSDILFKGLAEDGGLFLPTNIPKLGKEKLKSLSELAKNQSAEKAYQALAFEIMSLYIDSTDLSSEALKKIIAETYTTSTFGENIANLSKIKLTSQANYPQNLFFLELFHSPTLAFKDYALQFLGNLFNHYIKKDKRKLVVLGATSGDTGSAAIHALKNIQELNIFILHPHEKVSPLQRKQMCTVDQPNVHNLAIKGDFDDCQKIVKSLFNDQEFISPNNLLAINSINWGRIMAQIVYYFWAYFKSASYPEPIIFSVPTGNFGNILAAYFAKEMGLPIHQLILATNENDILYRLVNYNDYSSAPLKKTHSPSMDILISSNLERYLHLLYTSEEGQHHDTQAKFIELMKTFKDTGKLSLSSVLHEKLQAEFKSARISNEETLTTIREIKGWTNKVVDPHSAIAFKALEKTVANHPLLKDYKAVVVGTASPGKFKAALNKAKVNFSLPQALEEIKTQEEFFTIVENDPEQVKQVILKGRCD